MNVKIAGGNLEIYSNKGLTFLAGASLRAPVRANKTFADGGKQPLQRPGFYRVGGMIVKQHMVHQVLILNVTHII